VRHLPPAPWLQSYDGDLSPKRNILPVRPAPPVSPIFLGRSSALDFRLDENGCGGFVEDNPLRSARQARCCNFARRLFPRRPIERAAGAGRRLKPPPGRRRLLCWGSRAAAAEKVAGAPPVAGTSRAPPPRWISEYVGQFCAFR
jgi:hypothetical protein